MRRLVLFLVLAACGVPGSELRAAQDADPIREELDRARAAADGRLDAARAGLARAIEAKCEEVAARSDLPALKRLEGAKKAFEATGEPPEDPLLAAARKEYAAAVQAARKDLRTALETARAAYTKARDVEAADAIDAEIRAATPRVTPPPPPARPAPADPLTGAWRIIIGDPQNGGREGPRYNKRYNAILAPSETVAVRNAIIRRNLTSPVKFVLIRWRKDDPDANQYTLILPGGGIVKGGLGPRREVFRGSRADGTKVTGYRIVE